VYGENEGEVFLGARSPRNKKLSEVTMQKVRRRDPKIIDEQYSLAKKLISTTGQGRGHGQGPARAGTIEPSRSRNQDGRPPRPPKPAQATQQRPGGGAGCARAAPVA